MTRRGALLSRICASLVGGYAFVGGFTMMCITLGVAAGLRYADAQTLARLLAFFVFLVAFLWAYVASTAARVWFTLAGGGLAMSLAAWALAAALA
jgi:hypothetical protein